ncbi:relaxase/mobilization nuclease domain-containing protein [Enterobacter ludwigii]|uniref:relaxase/mobilization nuclease domain-containing protein n=1 Tax=Enterobacter ludwigii TaxID=299767 RepID=UPI0020176264|nr:relaxase/mobilization nuclease domain-containing protein [Enterobacter ludwigii]
MNKPTFHAFLSLPKDEKLTDEQWQEIAKDYLKEMNIDIDKHQYICVRHKDTDKDHIHIVANRVGLDGSVWHGQHSAFNTIAACERLEVKHGLTITQGLKGQNQTYQHQPRTRSSKLFVQVKNQLVSCYRTPYRRL